MAKRIAIIGSVGVPGRYGGFETLVENLVAELGDAFELTVYCSGKRYPEPRPAEYRGAKLVYLPLEANGAQSIPYDVWSIARAVRDHDVLLVLGVGGAAVLPLVRLLTRVKIVAHIGGVEWRREKWGRLARWFLRASEWLAVRVAHEVIADNDGIRDYVDGRYGRPSRLIAYGGDHVTRPRLGAEVRERFPFAGGRYAFSVCRIEPENNIHLLLEGFPPDAGLALVLVGNWEASGYGRALRARHGARPGVHLLDPIYEPETLNALRGHCDVYLHGHSVGGTNPSLVEAMHLGRPVLAYDVVYNRATTDGRALYFRDARALGDLVRAGSHAGWARLGREMGRIARRRYTWKGIASQYAAVFSRAA